MSKDDIACFFYHYMPFLLAMIAMLVIIVISDNKPVTFIVCSVLWIFMLWYLWAKDTYDD